MVTPNFMFFQKKAEKSVLNVVCLFYKVVAFLEIHGAIYGAMS